MPAVHRTYYCSQCRYDWPPLQAYNTCPKCQRCTVAETADDPPNETLAANLRARYLQFERYLAERTPAQTTVVMAGLERAFAATHTIPDPTEAPDAN